MAFDGALNKFNLDTTLYSAGGGTVVARSAYDWQNFRLKSIQIYNHGATLTGGNIEVSNDNTNWGTLIGIAGGTLATKVLWQYTSEDAYKYYRFNRVVAAGTIALNVRFA